MRGWRLGTGGLHQSEAPTHTACSTQCPADTDRRQLWVVLAGFGWTHTPYRAGGMLDNCTHRIEGDCLRCAAAAFALGLQCGPRAVRINCRPAPRARWPQPRVGVLEPTGALCMQAVDPCPTQGGAWLWPGRVLVHDACVWLVARLMWPLMPRRTHARVGAMTECCSWVTRQPDSCLRPASTVACQGLDACLPSSQSISCSTQGHMPWHTATT